VQRQECLEALTRGLLVDTSSFDMVDPFMEPMLATTTAMAKVLHAETAGVGMQPAVAVTNYSSTRPRPAPRPDRT